MKVRARSPKTEDFLWGAGNKVGRAVYRRTSFVPRPKVPQCSTVDGCFKALARVLQGFQGPKVAEQASPN